MKQKQTQIENKLYYTYQRGEEKYERTKESGINRSQGLYTKEINNKDILHTTGNYTQYLAIIYNGL